MIEDGLDALRDDEALLSGPAFDRWVRDELQPAIAEYEADRSTLVPIAEVEARLAELHRHATGG